MEFVEGGDQIPPNWFVYLSLANMEFVEGEGKFQWGSSDERTISCGQHGCNCHCCQYCQGSRQGYRT